MIAPKFSKECPRCHRLSSGGRCSKRRLSSKLCAAAGCRSKKRADCGAPGIRFTATPMYGRAEMSEEPRTEVLRRRIELYLHCICDGITTAEPSEFIQQIAEAGDELLILTAERTFRYDTTAHRSR